MIFIQKNWNKPNIRLFDTMNRSGESPNLVLNFVCPRHGFPKEQLPTLYSLPIHQQNKKVCDASHMLIKGSTPIRASMYESETESDLLLTHLKNLLGNWKT